MMHHFEWPYSTHIGERVYVIGDIHGQYRLFDNIVRQIHADLNARPASTYRVICLGDILDRGEGAREVLDTLMELSATAPWTVLRGNHEDMLLRVVGDPDYLTEWTRYGGLETLLSFGLHVNPLTRNWNIPQIHAQLVETIGDGRLTYLNSLSHSSESGDYFFCHAGINPDMPLTKQNPNDLMWIREPFLQSDLKFEKHIVHGHTPVDKIDLRHNRMNIDTGAYISGRLTCVVLEANHGYAFDTRQSQFTSIF